VAPSDWVKGKDAKEEERSHST